MLTTFDFSQSTKVSNDLRVSEIGNCSSRGLGPVASLAYLNAGICRSSKEESARVGSHDGHDGTNVTGQFLDVMLSLNVKDVDVLVVCSWKQRTSSLRKDNNMEHQGHIYKMILNVPYNKGVTAIHNVCTVCVYILPESILANYILSIVHQRE